MNEFAKDIGAELETGNEAPASVTIRGYYKGYSVLVTNRDPGTETYPLVQKAIKTIDWMAENGFKPSWADKPEESAIKCETCGAPAQEKSGTSKSGKPYHGIFCTVNKDHVRWLK